MIGRASSEVSAWDFALLQIELLSMKDTDTTRYLCAAAQLDQSFCKQVMTQVVDEEYKAISVSGGVDFPAVIKHCINSKRRKTIRDAILTGLLLLVVVSPSIVLAILLFVVAVIVVYLEAWITYYKIIAKTLLKNTFNPDAIHCVMSPSLKRRVEEIDSARDGNVVVYSGFSPFVGSGFDVGGWSFAIDISKGKEKLGKTQFPQSFTVLELQDYIEEKIANLHIENLSIEDKLYVNGKEIRDNPSFLADVLSRPVTYVDLPALKSFINKPTEIIRHYKSIRMVKWKGDIVLTIFLRFIIVGAELYSEADYFLLTPLKEEYRSIDNMQLTPTFRKQWDLFWESVAKTFFLIIAAPFAMIAVLNELLQRSGKRKKYRRLVLDSPNFDYGATANIRELASSKKYRQYFQKLDKEMYFKIIERQILDKITEFLDSKNIDTSELKSRQTAILNNGVMVTGGSISAQNITAGDKAKSIISSFTQSASQGSGSVQQQSVKDSWKH